MAKKASETGDTVLSDMLVSGSKNIIQAFPGNPSDYPALLAGIIFMVPGALAVRKPKYAGRKSGSFDTGHGRARYRSHSLGSLHNNYQSRAFPYTICPCD